MEAGTARAGGNFTDGTRPMLACQSALRKKIRMARRELTPQQQSNAANNLLTQMRRQPLYLQSRRLALYLPNDGEIDPTPILNNALKQGKQCYLPVLYRGGKNRLLFGRVVTLDDLVLNRFGIPEPNIAKYGWVFANHLDLILAPLVAFDLQGNRIGMGGGFYDRSLKHLRQERNWQRPRILGLAHEFQRVAVIGRNAWDIPLRGAVTDQNIYNFDILNKDK